MTSKSRIVSAVFCAVMLSGGSVIHLAGAAESKPSAELLKADPKVEAARVAQERAKLITPLAAVVAGQYETVPNDKGEYICGAESAKPLLTGAVFELQKDNPVKGSTFAYISGCDPVYAEQPDTEGLYWKIGNIKPGRYWVALQASEVAPLAPAVFLNGRIVQCTRGTDPVQAAPGFWIYEAQVDQPLELKTGDEIAVQFMGVRDQRVGALFLRSRPPERGRIPLGTHMGGGIGFLYTAHSVVAEAGFRGTDGRELPLNGEWWTSEQKTDLPRSFETGPDGRPVVTVRLSNPLPVPVTLDYQCEVLSYYRRQVGKETQPITLAPHEAVTRKVSFDIIPDEPSYSVVVRIQAVKPPLLRPGSDSGRDYAGQATLDWPEGDEISYFPGLRHSVAWPNPWKYKTLRRVVFTQPINSPRQILSLNGVWEKAFTTSIEAVFPIPAGLTFSTMTLPGSFWGSAGAGSKDIHGMYLRRKFVLPPEAAGRTYLLNITFVRDEATVWVNGQKVGNVRGGSTPLVADATKAMRVGENEIVILVRDLVVLMNPVYVNPAKPEANPFYLDVPGFASAVSGPGIGGVTISTSPIVFAEDVQALPSFRKKTLTARFSLLNHREGPAKVRVKTHVLDNGKSALVLDDRTLILSPDKPEPIVVEKAWKDPQLWGPENPHLYVLAVETFDEATGERIDFARARFGFRECWMQGPSIMLNGVPIRPKGCAEPRDETVIMTRGTGGHGDYYDELGRMGFEPVSGLINSSSRHNVERDLFWQSAKTNAVEHLKGWINHPSVVAWDLSNEWLCFTDTYGADPMFPGRRFKDFSDHVRAYDPTRWTLGNGEGDFMGLLDNHCFHYLTPSLGAEGALGHLPCLPDAEFWRPLDRHFRPDEGVPRDSIHAGTILRPDLKVIFNSEHLWKVNETMPPGLTEVCGESDLLGWAIDSASPAASWFWKQRLDGNRDLGVSPIHHYRHAGIHSRACLPRTFLMPDTAHHGFSGKPFVKLFKLFNDELHPARMDLKWELMDSRGQAIVKDSETVTMTTAQSYNGKIEFVLPKVTSRSRFVFRTRLFAAGQFVTGQELDIDVWPDRPVKPGALERKIFVFDPKGDTAKALDAAGVNFKRLTDLVPPADAMGNTLLVVGEGALDDANVSKCLSLIEYTEKGGRVIFLAQNVTPLGLPVATKLGTTHWASLCFNRMAAHPVLDGVSDWDLSFWANDRVVGKGAYAKPESGSSITLIDSGYQPRGLEYVQLMEQYRGQGVYLLCQLPLIEKYNQEPMTREILARLLRYAAKGATFVTPTQTLQAVIAKGGDMQKRMDSVGVKYVAANLDAPLNPGAPILAEAGLLREATDQQKEALVRALADGCALVISCPAPEDAAWLSKLAGTPITLTVPPYLKWQGRGMRNGYSPFTAGLSHQDLYWKRFDLAESGGQQSDDPELAIEPLQDYAVAAPGAKVLVWPGALLELKVGKGTLLLDQRRWMTSSAELAKPASRNVSALMQGIGVRIAPAVVLRQLSKDLDYKTVDLTPFNNRSLRDEKSEDGEGGWSDQGSGADLKAFKTGKINCQGIPFLVGDHPNSCIVLRNKNRPYPDKYPSEVTIPVGYPVEGFYFLQGFAYCGGALISVFQVVYDDGTTYDVKVIGDVNAKDWAQGPSNGFPYEKDTFSSVAWTGSSSMFPVVAVYKMLWVNPKPEVPVKAIRYFKTREMITVHMFMGLTSVLKREVRKLSPEERTHLADLMKQASEAAKKKDNATAEKLFRQALSLDSQSWEVYQQLADILEQSKNEDALLEHYHLWVRQGAVVPLPYNRIAEMLEKKNDLRGALEFYTRSLQVEWNQPPVIEAKKRLQAAVAK